MELLRGTNQRITFSQSGYPPEKLLNGCWLLYELDQLEVIVSNQPVGSSIDEWSLRTTDDENEFILEIPSSTEIADKDYILYLNVDNLYYSVSFKIINSFNSLRRIPLTADFSVAVPKPRVGTIGFTEIEVLRPTEEEWSENFNEMYLQVRTPVNVGQWRTVGSIFRNSQDSFIRLTALEKCTTFELRWTVKYNNVGTV